MIDERIMFEERYDNPVYGTTTLYFTAPVEMLDGEYPDAESTEICVEFPTDMPYAEESTVMLSPTKDGLDYDWFDAGMAYEEIEALIALAEKFVS